MSEEEKPTHETGPYTNEDWGMDSLVDDAGVKIQGPVEKKEVEHLLDEAKRLVSGDRNDDYGPPEEDMEKVAGMLSALFGWNVKPSHIPMIMICVKLARESHRPKHDNAVDIAGWSWCLDECVKADNGPRNLPIM